MKIFELMHRNVQVIGGDTTIREAARRMSEHSVGVLPVCDNDKIIGILTDRDIVVRSIARGDDPDKARASEAMTGEVEWCFDDDSVEDAARKMSDRQIQRLIALNHDKKLVGIVTLADLVRASREIPGVTHVVEEIKAPTKPSAAGAKAQQIGH